MSQNKITTVNTREFASAVVANSEDHNISKLLDIYVEAINLAHAYNQKQSKSAVSVNKKIDSIKQLGF